MRKIIIKYWKDYGDYMLFANMVDETKEWIMLQAEPDTITAIGKEPALEKYGKLLGKRKILFTVHDL